MSDTPESDPPQARPSKRKVSVFACAHESADVTAVIDVFAVLEIRPDWTPQQAAAFLRENGEVIGFEMLGRGTRVLISILHGGRDVN